MPERSGYHPEEENKQNLPPGFMISGADNPELEENSIQGLIWLVEPYREIFNQAGDSENAEVDHAGDEKIVESLRENIRGCIVKIINILNERRQEIILRREDKNLTAEDKERLLKVIDGAITDFERDLLKYEDGSSPASALKAHIDILNLIKSRLLSI
ncbi:MAG: hypothetical protein COT81_00415 [Candidatus Buchananbacteria bacterium CG10_big_fil_rev_8_21_14_0_10_42_9]|uniref:Uncharacterized protein n=1 Tax=Candidatus Buchananbacteria bacterium CG10_big_fil_rev_8_21_14_0_10_42_9 TaxID=1974526 RepID=A0A2H0W2L2_9BACT|nr:MAG: hypothetical protein COT81_00415 [Candidatus Buchananbacteria bacterium CG10_big_fil_rev_8_21_14_0_10_42_9]